MYIFVPYSMRSFNGIVNDARKLHPTATIVAMVLEGENPPDGYRALRVFENGFPDLFVIEKGSGLLVVANGGPTALTVAAVLLAQRLRCKLVNIQPYEVVAMETHCEG